MQFIDLKVVIGFHGRMSLFGPPQHPPPPNSTEHVWMGNMTSIIQSATHSLGIVSQKVASF